MGTISGSAAVIATGKIIPTAQFPAEVHVHGETRTEAILCFVGFIPFLYVFFSKVDLLHKTNRHTVKSRSYYPQHW